jgi:hypothetical protein
MHTPTRTALVAISLACVAVLAGCERGDGLGRRYRIWGKVTYKGQPLKKAMIFFAPVDEGLSASGRVDNGVYRNLTSRWQDDGILPGKYHVIFLPFPANPGPPRPAAEPTTDQGKPLDRPVTTSGVPVPEKYSDSSRSGLDIEVTPTTFAFDFDLQD